MKKTKFQIVCEAVAETTDVGVMFVPDSTLSKPYEDDGTLHITKRGMRACFDVGRGQSLSGAEQNKRAVAVLSALGLPKTEDTMVDEEEGDDV